MFPFNGGLRAQQQAQQAAKQHRIAVLDFNDSAVNGASQAVFGVPVDIGKGISQMLAGRLTSDGTYQVTARTRVEEVLKAQNAPNSAVADPGAAAKIGHRLGVDAVVAGQVTQFGWDDQAGKPQGTPDESAGRKGPDAPAMRRAIVTVTAELIDTNTGQVLATANSKGVSRRTGTKLLDNAATAGEGGSPAMDSSNFAQSMIGEAATAAVNELAKELEGESANLSTWAPPPLRGLIIDASSPNLVINVGSAAGLKVGDKMLVTRVVHVERDRVTETAVGAVEDEVGVLTIVSVKDDSAVGRFSGAESPKTGDQVRPLQ
ncbi:MAG: CsgG/HfaB family protein [Terracidiphilus sp.]